MDAPLVTPLGAQTPHAHPLLPKIIAALSIVIVGAGYFVAAQYLHWWPYKESVPATNTVQYRNEQFGFRVDLPESWRGYTVVNQKEDIYDITGATTTNNGVIGNFPIFSIRHPLWTQSKPRQDIPIMVFTSDYWDCVQAEHCSVGAAPIPPRELAYNSQYVFALPARYNYAFPEGFEEVEHIIQGNPVHVFEPAPIVYRNDQFGFELTIPSPLVRSETKNEQQATLWLTTAREQKEMSAFEGAGYRYTFSLTALKDSSSSSLSCDPWRNQSDITISGVHGLRCTGWPNDPDHVGFFFRSPTLDAHFSIETYKYSGATKDLIDQIVSSIHFTR